MNQKERAEAEAKAAKQIEDAANAEYLHKQAKRRLLDMYLEERSLTEWKAGCWCQSGAQAGWGPDLDNPNESAVVVNGWDVRINNDLFSERVKAIAKMATSLGFKVSLKNEGSDS